MGSALSSCMEAEGWDSHHHVRSDYSPGYEQPHDMHHPLSHYFISAGHNSYLEGNQLTSDAGVGTIVACLERGCKVIELDTYDGPEGHPIATHGGTLTSTVTVRDCAAAIRRCGFKHSPWPVILTLENHVEKQQEVLAADLKEILGTHLFEPTLEQLARSEWLSPADLKDKVLVRMKVKAGAVAPALEKLVYIRNSKIASYDVDAGPAQPASHSLPDNKLPKAPEYSQYSGSSSSSPTPAATNPPPAAAPAAAAAAATPASGVEATATGDKAAAAVVATEEAIAQEQDDTLPTSPMAAGTSPAAAAAPGTNLATPMLSAVLRYGAKHLLRVYPGAWHMLQNTNLSPDKAWSYGASLAALNWQLWDEPVAVNLAFFTNNGNGGYVLKPDWMLGGVSQGGLPERSPRQLQVTVFSAHVSQGRAMGFAKDDIYVELQVVGVPCDVQTVKTKHVNNSGNLVADEKFSLPVKFPEMAVLLVKIKDADLVRQTDSVLGIKAIALGRLRQGQYKLRLYALGEKPVGQGKRDMWVKLEANWLGAGQ